MLDGGKAVLFLAAENGAGRIHAHDQRRIPQPMHTYTAIVERCPDTGLYVGYVPGFPGAHSQGETLDELNDNLKEVVAMILDDGVPEMSGEYVGTQIVAVA